ncbi:hypothetical protein OT109_10410 [Phycisphaeraceae bacterium D3-23]
MALPVETSTPDHKRPVRRWLWTAALLACFLASGALAGQWLATQNHGVAGRDAQRDSSTEPVSNAPAGVVEDEPGHAPTD